MKIDKNYAEDNEVHHETQLVGLIVDGSMMDAK